MISRYKKHYELILLNEIITLNIVSNVSMNWIFLFHQKFQSISEICVSNHHNPIDKGFIHSYGVKEHVMHLLNKPHCYFAFFYLQWNKLGVTIRSKWTNIIIQFFAFLYYPCRWYGCGCSKNSLKCKEKKWSVCGLRLSRDH